MAAADEGLQNEALQKLVLLFKVKEI